MRWKQSWALLLGTSFGFEAPLRTSWSSPAALISHLASLDPHVRKAEADTCPAAGDLQGWQSEFVWRWWEACPKTCQTCAAASSRGWGTLKGLNDKDVSRLLTFQIRCRSVRNSTFLSDFGFLQANSSNRGTCGTSCRSDSFLAAQVLCCCSRAPRLPCTRDALQGNRLSCALPHSITSDASRLRSLRLGPKLKREIDIAARSLVGNLLGFGSEDLPDWVHERERQPFLYKQLVLSSVSVFKIFNIHTLRSTSGELISITTGLLLFLPLSLRLLLGPQWHLTALRIGLITSSKARRAAASLPRL